MRIKSFEDVNSWKIGKELYLDLHARFSPTRDFTFRDQLLRATLSITNNIAEGFDRGSDKELRHFLLISRGSCAEVRSMLHIAHAADKLSIEEYDVLVEKTQNISKLLSGFIKKLETVDSRQRTKT